MDREVNDELAKTIGHLVLANVSLGVQLRRAEQASAPESPPEAPVER